MGKSTSEKLWCIRIVSGAAYLYNGGAKVENFLNIVGAKEVTTGSKTSGNVCGSSPTVQTRLKVTYTHNNLLRQSQWLGLKKTLCPAIRNHVCKIQRTFRHKLSKGIFFFVKQYQSISRLAS